MAAVNMYTEVWEGHKTHSLRYARAVISGNF